MSQAALFERAEIQPSPQDYTLRDVMREAAALYRESGDIFCANMLASDAGDPDSMDAVASIGLMWQQLREKARSVEGAEKLIRHWQKRFENTEWWA